MDVNVKNQLVSRVAKVIMYVDKNPNSNLKEISKSLEIDYNFVSKIIQRCEEVDIMKTENVAREKKTIITGKGKKISELIKQIEKIME